VLRWQNILIVILHGHGSELVRWGRWKKRRKRRRRKRRRKKKRRGKKRRKRRKRRKWNSLTIDCHPCASWGSCSEEARVATVAEGKLGVLPRQMCLGEHKGPPPPNFPPPPPPPPPSPPDHAFATPAPWCREVQRPSEKLLLRRLLVSTEGATEGATCAGHG
jgi:hypothetical protein